MSEIQFKDCARISHTWTVRGGLFSLFRKKVICVDAEQVSYKEDETGMTATAKLTISVDHKVVHQADIPWPMPKSSIMLSLQVYTLSQYPNYKSPEWQDIMEKFCYQCEGFERPHKLWWTEDTPD